MANCEGLYNVNRLHLLFTVEKTAPVSGPAPGASQPESGAFISVNCGKTSKLCCYTFLNDVYIRV